MSQDGIGGVRAASILGYCLLPLVLLSVFSIFLDLQFVFPSALFLISCLTLPSPFTFEQQLARPGDSWCFCGVVHIFLITNVCDGAQHEQPASPGGLPHGPLLLLLCHYDCVLNQLRIKRKTLLSLFSDYSESLNISVTAPVLLGFFIETVENLFEVTAQQKKKAK